MAPVGGGEGMAGVKPDPGIPGDKWIVGKAIIKQRIGNYRRTVFKNRVCAEGPVAAFRLLQFLAWT